MSISAVTSDTAGRVISWIEGDYAFTVSRDSAGRPLLLRGVSPGRKQIVAEFKYSGAGGTFSGVSGETSPSAASPQSLMLPALVRDATNAGAVSALSVGNFTDLPTLRSNYPAARNAGKSAVAAGVPQQSDGVKWWPTVPPVYSWKDIPDATQYLGDVIVRDVGVRHSRWTSDGLYWQPAQGSAIELDAQLFDVTFTDDKTSEQVLWEYTLPPGLLRENWSIELETKCTFGAFATAVTRGLRLYLGSAQMAGINNGGSTSVVTSKWHGVAVDNRNSFSSQIGEAAGFAGVGAQQSGVSFQTTTADLRSNYRTLQLRGYVLTLGSGTMSNTLHSVRCRLRPGIN